MDDDEFRRNEYLTAIWLIIGLLIFVGNSFTGYVLWLSKVRREKSEVGRHIHSLWNLISTYLAFCIVGLSLFICMAGLLARNGEISSGLCNFLAFLHTVGFNFTVIGILVGFIDRTYSTLKPFKYHSYVHDESKVPVIVFVCCTLYGVFMGILPLTRLGNYSQSKYTTCLITWGKDPAVIVCAVLGILLIFTIGVFVCVNVRLMWKIYANRRQMKVSIIRRKETMVFVLVLSSLFLICLSPYMIAMLVSSISPERHPGEIGISVLFGITLVPLLVSPVLTYILHGYYQDECKKLWGSIYEYLSSKRRKATTCRTEIEMEVTNQPESIVL